MMESFITLKEHKAHDGEEINQDDSKNEGEDDGPEVPGDRTDDIPQRLLPMYQLN